MKIVRYFLVGGVAAAVDISIFFVFAKQLGLNYLMVGMFGFLLATFVNYLLSIRHVFETGIRFEKKREVMLVYFVSLVGLLFNQAILYVCIDFIRIEMMLSKVIATISVFFWNYFSRRHFIFRDAN